MDIREKFQEICNLAYEADIQSYGSYIDFEEYLEQLLSFCITHLPQFRTEIIECFVLVGKDQIKAPEETLPFCMHSLKLFEVFEALKRYLQSLDPTTRLAHTYPYYLADLEESYESNWEDRDLWRIYDRID